MTGDATHRHVDDLASGAILVNNLPRLALLSVIMLPGCTATSAMIAGHRATDSQRFVDYAEAETQILSSERSVARASITGADAGGLLLKVEQRAVCPEAARFEDRFVARADLPFGTMLGAAAIDSVVGAGAWWGVSRMAASNPELTPDEAEGRGTLALVGASTVVGAGLAAWAYPFMAQQVELPRTEYRDVWCGEWATVPSEGWMAVTTTEALSPTAVDDNAPSTWTPSSAELDARAQQLRPEMAEGLARSTGIVRYDVTGMMLAKVAEQGGQPASTALQAALADRMAKSPKAAAAASAQLVAGAAALAGGATPLQDTLKTHLTKTPRAADPFTGEPADRLEGAAAFGGGAPVTASAEGWRVPAATLAPLAWATILKEAGGAMPAGVPVLQAVVMREKGHEVSGGAARLSLDGGLVQKQAVSWACDTAGASDVASWVASQPETVHAAAVLKVATACPDRAAALKKAMCERSSRSATAAGELPAPKDYAAATALCGTADWSHAAWWMVDAAVKAGEWDEARSLVDTHDALLASSKPTAAVRQTVGEGKIGSLLTRARAGMAPDPENPGLPNDRYDASDALEAMAPLMDAHAKSFPARATWVAQQRYAATLLATSVVRSMAKDETDASVAREKADALVPLAGKPWRTNVEAVIKQEEAVAAAKQAAEERRRAAEEAAEERRRAAEEASGGACYEWYYPSINACGLIFAGTHECREAPSSMANSTCRNLATQGSRCRCP